MAKLNRNRIGVNNFDIINVIKNAGKILCKYGFCMCQLFNNDLARKFGSTVDIKIIFTCCSKKINLR